MDTVTFFKCLSDETRLYAMQLILLREELCVCELTEALGESQPKISRHLAQLRTTGILHAERRGQWVFYSLAPALPEWATDVLRTSTQANALKLEQLIAQLEKGESVNNCC